MTVAEGVRLPVSRHFFYSTFGVRGRHDNITRTGNYVSSLTPGTGFFFHNTESHSYHVFVRQERQKLKQNFWTLIAGKEPNFDKENKRVESAFAAGLGKDKQRILSSYQNVLALAKEEELLQRVVRAIKDKMGNRPNKMMVSIMSHYKSSIATLEHDVRSAQINIDKLLNEEQLNAWQQVVENFGQLVSARRVWSVYLEDNVQCYEQVFFDLGIFDYIQSPYDTPVIHNHIGICTYLYPFGAIVARSSVDFDVHPWSELSIQFNTVDISTLAVRPRLNSHSHGKHRSRHSDALSTLYGAVHSQMVGEFMIPQLNLHFFVNRTAPVENFVKSVGAFMKTNSPTL